MLTIEESHETFERASVEVEAVMCLGGISVQTVFGFKTQYRAILFLQCLDHFAGTNSKQIPTIAVVIL